ncbi:DNA-binding transcriptional LysR family regulator [Sinorhizobium fredii]
MIQAAQSGLGAAYLLRCLVAAELKSGTLVDLAPRISLPKVPFNALHAFGRTPPLRVRLFCDFVAEAAKAIAVM